MIRYKKENPDDPQTLSTWVEDPEEYAVGFPEPNRQSAGGLDLQYGYDSQGNFDGRCMATLVNTGDRLRDNPALADQVAAGGPTAVHGVQLTPMDLVKPRNVPPFGSWFVDYDTYFEDPAVQGHVGDVEVWRPCEPGRPDLEEVLPDYPPQVTIIIDLPLCKDGERPESRKCRDREPDLKVEKHATVKRCTMDGGCDFIITVTNVGDAPYHGKIVLDEVTLPIGSVLVSGPNAPWTCAPPTSPMTCTHPAMTLDPGQSVDLKLGFKPAAGFKGRFFANCARYDYDRSGKPIFGRTSNDRACARIPVCRRGDRDRICQPPQDRTDLILKKRARTPVCSADGICFFVIDIINNGGQTYSGPLTVTDNYPTGAPVSSTFGPSPPWSCGPNGPGQFRCDNPGVVLVPGATTSITVKTVLPVGYDKDLVQNCAEVKGIPGETELSNNKACATERVRHPNGGKPALRITKTCENAAAANVSTCRITVTSVGTEAPSGPVHVADAATLIGGGSPVAIQSVTPDGPEWTCTGAPSTSLSCDIPGAVMTPGTSRHFDVTVSAGQEFENCARGSFGPAPGDDQVFPFGQACAKGGNATNIRVEKTGDPECRAGQPCHFEITITNDGDKPFSAPMRIGDAIGVDGVGRLEGVAINEITPSFGCAPDPAALPSSCVMTLTLDAHQSRSHRVTVTIPDSVLAGKPASVNAENCVGVVPPDQQVSGGAGIAAGDNAGGDHGKAYACHPFTLTHEVTNECSDGFVLNDAGRCVCPKGTTFKNGKCTGGETPPPPPPEKPCVLLKGQIRTDDGRCVCPKGADLVNGACVRTTTECTGGQVATAEGSCTCPRGTELRNGECQPPRAKCTIPGAAPLSDGSGCGCPEGTHLTKKGCVKDKPKPQCTIQGQFLNGKGVCVCPRGQQSNGRKCVAIKKQPPQQQQCTISGQIHNKRGQCVCPRGTAVMDDACVRVEKKQCPPGTVGRYPHCRVVDDGGPKIYINPGDLLNLIPRHNRRQRYDDNQGGTIPRRPGTQDY